MGKEFWNDPRFWKAKDRAYEDMHAKFAAEDCSAGLQADETQTPALPKSQVGLDFGADGHASSVSDLTVGASTFQIAKESEHARRSGLRLQDELHRKQTKARQQAFDEEMPYFPDEPFSE